MEVAKLLSITEFTSKISVRKENRRYRDSLGPMAKLVKTPKLDFLMNFIDERI